MIVKLLERWSQGIVVSCSFLVGRRSRPGVPGFRELVPPYFRVCVDWLSRVGQARQGRAPAHQGAVISAFAFATCFVFHTSRSLSRCALFGGPSLATRRTGF